MGDTQSLAINSTIMEVSDSGDFDLDLDLDLEAIEAQFAALVIPPPPGESSPALEKIQIVPPITAATDSGRQEFKKKRGVRRYTRSNSVDTFFMKFLKETEAENAEVVLQNSSSSTSALKSSKTSLDMGSDKPVVPPRSLSAQFSSSTTNTSNQTSALQDIESPATVSEKLSNLLHMMPSFVSSDATEPYQTFSRSASLRLTRSASTDLSAALAGESTSSGTNGNGAQHGPLKRSNSFRINRSKAAVDVSQRRSSLDLPEKKKTPNGDIHHAPAPTQSSEGPQFSSKYSRHLRKSASIDTIPTDSGTENQMMKTSSSSDTFASLKAKLQSYRDLLISKTGVSPRSQKSTDSGMTTNGEVATKSKPLQRSNSFTLGFIKSRRKSLDSVESGSDRGDLGGDLGVKSSSEQALGPARTDKVDAVTVPTTTTSSAQDKRTVLMWNTLSVPRTSRPTFRPLSGSSTLQVGRVVDVNWMCKLEYFFNCMNLEVVFGYIHF
jgi:hypothetical protein